MKKLYVHRIPLKPNSKKVLFIFILSVFVSCNQTSRVPFVGVGSGGIQTSQSPSSSGGIGGLSGPGGVSGSAGLSGGFTLHPDAPCPHGQICDPTYHPETDEDRKFSF